ncbi:MAG TPA: ester cyclase, partial [Ferruginibacter sp.]|nr:ester cyclase [Ferruginibacter sp.]
LNQDYAENAIVDDSMHAQPFIGRAAIMERKNIITSAASEAKITITNRIVTCHQVRAEWVATGIHTGDLPGLPASGRPFSIHGVTVVIRHEGKIVREALYYDVNQLHRQLG